MKRKTLLTLVLVALLVPALLLAAGLASGLPTAAQTTVRPGTSTILAVHGSVLTLSRAKQGTMQVSTGPGTIVLKNGTFTTASALAVGDHVLLNPRLRRSQLGWGRREHAARSEAVRPTAGSTPSLLGAMARPA